jgi:nucleotidyltransferase/DNA polymerase involved in DNA repair
MMYADFRSFFARCEQRIRGTDEPLVVYRGEGYYKRVIAASREARELGVEKRMRPRQVPPGVIWAYPRLDEYAKIFRWLFRKGYSEFRSEIFYMEPKYTDAFLVAAPPERQELSDRIMQFYHERGFDSSVGVSLNAVLAQMAAEYAKRSGKPEYFPIERVEEELYPLDVSAVPGIGIKKTQQLHALGIATVGEIANSEYENVNLISQRIYLSIQGRQGYGGGRWF